MRNSKRLALVGLWALIVGGLGSLADVEMVEVCAVRVVVTKALVLPNGSQSLRLRILDQLAKTCSFLEKSADYEAVISPLYRGKVLRVAPLKPGQLEKGNIFDAQVHSGGETLFWAIQRNDKKIPQGTSFQSTGRRP